MASIECNVDPSRTYKKTLREGKVLSNLLLQGPILSLIMIKRLILEFKVIKMKLLGKFLGPVQLARLTKPICLPASFSFVFLSVWLPVMSSFC